MSLTSRAEALLVTLANDPARRHQLFAGHTAALDEIAAGGDVYRILGEGSQAVRRLLRNSFGPSTADAMGRLSVTWAVSPDQARLFARWIKDGQIVGSHADLLALKAGGPLGFLLQSDHILEQRIHRMLRDGVPGFTARSSAYAQISTEAQQQIQRDFGAFYSADGEQIMDALAVLTPANEIVGYRLTRALPDALRAEGIRGLRSAAPWAYIHQGLGSKTHRMAEIIPYRLEGDLSYQQLFDATRWVVCNELGLPRDIGFQRLLLDDFLDSAFIGLRNDDLTGELLRRHYFPGQRHVSDDRLERAIRESMSVRRLRPQNFLPPNWPQVSPILGPLDVAERAHQELEDAAGALVTAGAGGSS
jgi:hypothetical protein